jgi:hypothetical protein
MPSRRRHGDWSGAGGVDRPRRVTLPNTGPPGAAAKIIIAIKNLGEIGPPCRNHRLGGSLKGESIFRIAPLMKLTVNTIAD